jgi:hypothetical protein
MEPAWCGATKMTDLFGETPPQKLDPVVELQAQLDIAQAELLEVAQELADINDILGPIDARDRNLRDQIRRTHTIVAGRIIHSLDGAPERAPLFAELTAIAERWGKTRNQRRATESRRKAWQREVDYLTRAIAKAKSKGGRHGAAEETG